jgi:ABC-type glycerol-3-phosphate transport system substrate-binding protein
MQNKVSRSLMISRLLHGRYPPGSPAMLLLLAGIAFLSACGAVQSTPPASSPADSTPAGGSPGPYDDNAKITIWIDQVRQPAVEAFKKAFPEKAALIKTEFVSPQQFPAKILQFNQANRGWPDVVFAEPNLVAQTVDEAHHFPLDLSTWIPADTLKGFAPGALDACTIGGQLVCLRYDLAQMVLFYNKPLMEQFGYRVPSTWEEYQALSEKVDVDHPGYIMGAFGDGWGFRTYFTPSGCAFGEVTAPDQVHINLADPACARAANLVQTMLDSGTLSTDSPFAPNFVKTARENKLLMIIGAAWYGEYLFGGKADSIYYQTAEGQLGVAAPLRWQDQTRAIVDAQGGGAWTVSNHTRNPRLAVDFLVWMSTHIEALGTGPDWPAYVPIQQAWGKIIAANPMYANDPFPIYQAAAGLISSQNNEPRYDSMSALTDAVNQVAHKNKKWVDVLPDLQIKLEALAVSAGYQVTNH